MTSQSRFDQEAASAARQHQAQLTKPPGSLGRLESLVEQLAGYQGRALPEARPAAVLLFAADHPVTRHGVSPFPSAVTAAMVRNFESGGAAASVLCRQNGLPLHVIDAGVFGSARDREIPAGDIRVEDALSPIAFQRCVELGRAAVREHAADARVLLLGEMGIGNTTVAAALSAWVTSAEDPGSVVGAGTGAEGSLLENKKQVVRDVVRGLRSVTSPREALRRAGGRELVAIFGAMQEALTQRIVILVDGFIVSSVAALLIAENDSARHGIVFAHRSGEQGHAAVLRHLDVHPLLDLDMRLGEASGALMAYPILERACALHGQMATFGSADVPGRTEPG